jgi:hypothetical protein
VFGLRHLQNHPSYDEAVSIRVDLTALAAEVARFGPSALLITTSTAGPPHVSSVLVTIDGEDLVMPGGRTTRLNASEHPAVTLVWASDADSDYCLVVDALAQAEPEETLRAQPTSAVLHRLASAVRPR